MWAGRFNIVTPFNQFQKKKTYSYSLLFIFRFQLVVECNFFISIQAFYKYDNNYMKIFVALLSVFFLYNWIRYLDIFHGIRFPGCRRQCWVIYYTPAEPRCSYTPKLFHIQGRRPCPLRAVRMDDTDGALIENSSKKKEIETLNFISSAVALTD